MIDKRMLVITFAILMSMGLTPVFAADSGQTVATVDVSPTVSILVQGDASWTDLAANNVLAGAKMINIESTSNGPVKISVSAANWTATNGGNMPLSALKFGESNTDLSNTQTTAIASLAAPLPGSTSSQDVNLNMQIPFGSTPDTYSTTVTWTATPV